MSDNTVYMVAKQARTFRDNTQPICPIQFHNYRGNIDKDHPLAINTLYKVLMINNVHMISKHLPGEDFSFGNCAWLAGTAFRKTPAKVVYKQVLRIINAPVNKTTKRLIPLSVCPCINDTNFDCYSPNLGTIFPGQIISIKLLVDKKWLREDDSSVRLIVDNTPDDECSVVDSYQLSQTHFNNAYGCNYYRYTIWPSHQDTKECKLFLGMKEMPEMFYVGIKPCPKGFTLNKDRKACFCDPLLHNKILSITSCDLDGETILRPANSWITADTVNGSHTYLMSSACPFDYCLPHSSHHKLSDPDSQCQFNRSGVLCGQCKQGLSVIFGSSQCKHCSNVYLLLIIPIAIGGLMLVIMLFMFHLTVTNGIITSFIFYFNIISINHLVIFPGCKSIICTMVMLINLNFGIETCFYNGMDDYASTWLYLAFPGYLILIAIILIVASRYSATVQRITAKKALSVLATIFLLSYTKILLIVCTVLFRYSSISQFPSNRTKVVWLVSPTTPLFSFKFIFLLIICSILFLLLLPFNVILLFTRRLFRFKCITAFKPLLDPYFAPYKDKAIYWTGLLLWIRIIILALSGFAKEVSLTAIGILLGGFLWWHGVIKPFRSKYENIHESLLILNLLAVHAIPLYVAEYKLAQILITISVVHFTLVVFFYCFICKFKYKNNINFTKFYDIVCRSKALSSSDQNSVEMKNKVGYELGNYQEFQEPLVEYEE